MYIKLDQFFETMSNSQNITNIDNVLLTQIKYFESTIIKNPTQKVTNDQVDGISSLAERLIDNNINTSNTEINTNILKISDIAINSNLKK